MVRKTKASATAYILTFLHRPIARQAQPGQFVQVLTAPGIEPFLPRPMSVFSTVPRQGTFSILFAVVGRGTAQLAGLDAGAELPVLGPLGNTFTLPDGCRHVLLVAGGVGLPPLDFWARRLMANKKKSPPDITLLVGARSKTERLRVPKIDGVQRLWSTDDGSFGFHGNVVQLLDKAFSEKKRSPAETMVYGCGPVPMLRALQGWLAQNHCRGQLSLEEMMACGFGVCSGCVVAANPACDGYDKYKRVCYDGPVFDAREVLL